MPPMVLVHQKCYCCKGWHGVSTDLSSRNRGLSSPQHGNDDSHVVSSTDGVQTECISHSPPPALSIATTLGTYPMEMGNISMKGRLWHEAPSFD
ncbi:hypothetical protein ECG_03423 [Echinococcus granulosus]|nr:hypothetical protein ECG_03423 [Echinococcus granulosus]